jgi:hypothetical protein
MALFSPSVTQSAAMQATGNFILSIIPQFTAANIVVGQENLVPEPSGTDFVVMTPMFRERLATNVDTYQDCAFTASIAAQVMTVTDIQTGAIVIGNVLFGPGVTPGTTISGQTSGAPGGIGEYAVSIAQTVSSGVLSSGTKSALQATKMTIQIDVHGPNSGDNAQVISTLWRDETGASFFQPPECHFTGSISANVLTVSEIASGSMAPQMMVAGQGVVPQTAISSQLTGNTGDVGAYAVSPSQTVSSEAMIASPLFEISPLYADDPNQVPFENA